MGKYRKKIIIVCCFLLAGYLIWFGKGIEKAYGQSYHDQVVRVGFCEMEGFFECDENGKESGYGVEVLNAIAEKSGLTFQYVHTDAWEKLTDMLRKGEIDLMMPVSDTKKDQSEFIYSSESIIYTYRAIMTKNERADLYYNDYDYFDNMKIAVVQSFLKNQNTMGYFKGLGVKPDFEVYDSYPNCRQALEEDQVDAVISNIMDYDKGMKVLARFNPGDNYIVMRMEDERITTINTALCDIKLDDPLFFNTLDAAYFPERNQTPLTREEAEYVEAGRKVRVGIDVTVKPFAYASKEQMEYQGIYVELLELLKEKTGLNLTLIPCRSDSELEQMLEEQKVDLIFPGSGSTRSNWKESNTFFKSDLVFLKQKSEVFDSANEKKIGYLQSRKSVANSLKKNIPDVEIWEYESYDAARQALGKGEIDAIAGDLYELSYYMQNPRCENLELYRYQTYQSDRKFAGTEEILLSILNKGIERISSSEIGQIRNKYAVSMRYEENFADLLYRNRNLCVATGVCFAICLVGLFLYMNVKRSFYEQIEAKNQELERANMAKSRFLSNVSHDMRTPMNAIMGMTSLALEEVEDKRAVKSYLENIYGSSHFLLGLINDVLDMAKIESGKLELHRIPYSMGKFQNMVRSTIEPLCREKNIQFVMTEIGNQSILVDPVRFNQIFLNLLSNAVKFTEEGGKVEYLIEKSERDSHLDMDFYVRDNGIGMTEEFQQKMFDPFSREEQKSDSGMQGTGLGLSITKSIVDAMGGTIEVKSQVGSGSEFHIHLLVEVNAISGENLEEELAQDYGLLQGKHILLVEDHPLNIMVAQKILENIGIQVTCAENGKVAVEMMRNTPPGSFDAILMDVRMPVMDGLTATREIRKLQSMDAATIPIIAMTANAYARDMEETRAAGMNAHMSKPIEKEKLYQVLVQEIGKEIGKGK